MATQEQMDSWLAQARTADGKPMTDERMSEVFDLVKPQYPHGWKGAIEAEVPKDKATREEIEKSVCWFVGGYPEVEDHGPHWYVTGAGYYVWIGS
jgi:hypothetical protein